MPLIVLITLKLITLVCMRFLRKTLAKYLVLLIQTSVLSQNFHSTNLSTAEGLLTNEIYDIFQDQLGNMWFATDIGVCMYNGYEFKNYTTKNGLTHNVVFQIKKYGDKLYFNTFKGGVCYLENDSIKAYEHNSNLLEEIGHEFVEDFVIEDDVFWFSQSNAEGLYSINQEGVINKKTFKDANATFFVKNIAGEKICGFANQYLKNKRFSIFKEIETFISIPTITFNLTLRPKVHKQYFAYGKNLIKHNEERILEEKLFDREVSSIYLDQQNNLWIGTYGGGVLYFENSALHLQPQIFLKGKTISDIFKDTQGNIWFSTTENGLFHINRAKSSYYHLNEKVMVVKNIESNVFCGTDNGNVYKVYPEKKELIYQNPSGFAIKNIHELDSAQILVNYRQINHLTKEEKAFNPATKDVNTIYTQHGKYLVTAYNGFKLFDEHKLFFDSNEHYFIDRVKKILSYTDDSLLIASRSGLYLYHNHDITKIMLDDVQSLEITDLKKWQNKLLISTKNNGLIILSDSFKTLNVLNQNNGLSSDNCLTVSTNDSCILVGSNRGLDIIKSINNEFEIQKINTTNYLYNSKVNSVCFLNNRIAIGTDYGIEIFETQLAEYPFSETQITKVKVNNLDHNLCALDFTYDQNNIEVFFVSPNFRNEVSYRYRLKGATNTWSTTKENSIKYSQLTSGNYQFEVQPFIDNQNGGLSNIHFTIKPHFTKAWWFISVVLVFGCCLVYLIFQDFKLKEKYKRDAIQATQKALRAQMNPHFLFNALSSIQSYILKNDKKLSVKYLNKFSKLVRQVLENSMYNYIPIQDDVNALENYIQLEKIRFKDKFEYNIIMDDKINVCLNKIPPLLLQPIVENAIWHGILHKKHGNGKVSISFSLHEEYIKCIVEDNGVGRGETKLKSASEGHKSIGLQLTKERLKVININSKNKIYLHIEDVNSMCAETGTRVVLTIPKV